MHVAQSTYLNGHGAIGTDIQVTQRRAGKVGDVLDGVLVQAQLPQVPVLGQRAAWDEVDDVVLEPQPLQARAAAVRQTSGIRHKVQSPRPPHNHRAANALLQASEALDAVVVQLELAKVAQGVEAVDGDDRVVRQVDSAKLWVLWTPASIARSVKHTIPIPTPQPTEPTYLVQAPYFLYVLITAVQRILTGVRVRKQCLLRWSYRHVRK